MFGKRREEPEPGPPGQQQQAAALIDPETGLPNHRQLIEILRREIARSLRYGDRSALVVFDVRIVGFEPSPDCPYPPSPARFVAAALLGAARDADVVARIDMTHFAVFLTESDYSGAQTFSSRARTALSTSPYARTEDMRGLYVRAWAGCGSWDPTFRDPAAYIRAAFEDLETSVVRQEPSQAWLGGRAAN